MLQQSSPIRLIAEITNSATSIETHFTCCRIRQSKSVLIKTILSTTTVAVVPQSLTCILSVRPYAFYYLPANLPPWPTGYTTPPENHVNVATAYCVRLLSENFVIMLVLSQKQNFRCVRTCGENIGDCFDQGEDVVGRGEETQQRDVRGAALQGQRPRRLQRSWRVPRARQRPESRSWWIQRWHEHRPRIPLQQRVPP